MDNNTMLMHADERYVKAVEIINAHGGYTASLVESQKCNGAKLGMMVNKEGSDVSPVFLLRLLRKMIVQKKLHQVSSMRLRTLMMRKKPMKSGSCLVRMRR